MRPVPWWVLVSASAAPVLLIGGGMLAAARQPAGYDPVSETISSLAAHGATDRWLMTTALVGTGVCHAVTASGLRPAAAGGRLLLAAGGGATVLVALLPLPLNGTSVRHGWAAGVAFTLLAVWPAMAFRRTGRVPWGLRPAVSVAAAVVLSGLVAWFAVALQNQTRVGLAERIAAGAQALWPLLVAVTARRVDR